VKGGVIQASPPTGVQSTKASFFGQFSEKEGSKLPGGWVDKGDINKKTGLSLGNYSGSPQSSPGVSLPFQTSVGRKGMEEGSLVRVTHPVTGERYIVPQVDVGPNQTLRASRDKGIDVNAPLAERMNYAGTAAQAKATGRQVFPTGQEIQWEVVTPHQLLREQHERFAAAGARSTFVRRQVPEEESPTAVARAPESELDRLTGSAPGTEGAPTPDTRYSFAEPVHDEDSLRLANQLRDASEVDRSPSPFVPAESTPPPASQDVTVDSQREPESSEGSRDREKGKSDTPAELEDAVGGDD
jgi:hypothetical protein